MLRQSLKLGFKTSVIAAALAALPIGTNAAGLGRISVQSALGQPLRAEIELTASREELSAMTAKLASFEAYRKAGIEYVPVMAGIKLVVDHRTKKTPVIRMTTDQPVNEPFLDLLIELDWNAGRLVREYTFLLDPVPDVLARKPVAAPEAKRGGAPVAQPSAVASPKQPEVSMEEKPRSTKPAEGKAPVQGKAALDGQGREVHKGDNLRKIAAEVRYDGVSLDQMLIAIFRNNKDAFAGDNINRLKTGKILAIPDRETVAAVDVKEARKTIAAHTRDFNAYRQKLAGAAAETAAPKEEAAQQVATGKIGAKVEEKAAAPSDSKDQLKVSKAEAPKDSRQAQGKIAALEEDLVAKDKALKEAQSRQAELEKNIQDLQKLVELKNQNLAQLQKQSGASVTPAPAIPASPPVTPEVKSEAQPPVSQEKPVETTASAEPAQPATPPSGENTSETQPPEQVQPAPEEVAKPAEPEQKPAPKVVQAPEPQAEPGFLDDLMGNPVILGGGVLVLGLLGLVAYRRGKRGKLSQGSEGPTTTTANLAANSVFGVTGGQSVDTSGSSIATDFSQASISAIDTDEGVDPVAEADVYMAYGRDSQAEEILLDALKTDPTRTAIHVKLLEIYAGRKNNKQFETLASDLYAQTGGVGADWEKTAAMGQKLDPANPLYGGAGVERQSVQTDKTVIIPAGEKQLRDTWTMPGELGQISSAIEKGGAAATVILEKPVEIATTHPENVPALDFDLDLGGPADSSAVSDPAGSPASATKAETPVVLDFDLDLGDKVQASPTAAALADIDPGKTIPGVAALDFDFNLDESVQAKPAPVAETAAALGTTNLDLGSPNMQENDEAGTKLELAKAYEEMGDKEGARELLGEVAKDGNAEQQARAKEGLARLG